MYQDSDGVSYTHSAITLSCPVCGGTEVVSAPLNGSKSGGVIYEDKPDSSPLGTPGSWWVVPMMCCDDDCDTLFGIVFAEEGISTIIGYALPDDFEQSDD